jgi:hypothetical protein
VVFSRFGGGASFSASSRFVLRFQMLLPGGPGDRLREHRADQAAIPDRGDQVVRQLAAVEHLRVLNGVDARGDGEAEPFDARRVGFGRAIPPVRLVDDYALRFGREPDEGRIGEMARAAELQKIGALVEIRADRLSKLLRAHRHQLFAGALCDEVVHLFLEQRQLAHNAAERERVRPAPAEDVPGREDPGADLVAAVDGIADLGQRHQRAVAVADRGDAVGEVDLSGFEHNLLLPRLVADERLVPVVLPAVEREVHVRVDQPGKDPAAARVDLGRAGRNGDGAAGSDRRDPRAEEQDYGIGDRGTAGSVDDGAADDRRRRRRRLRRQA